MTLQKQKHHHNNIHRPVLAEAVLDVLNPKEGESYLDLTAGYGGHASLVLERTKNPKQAVLVDRDSNAISSLGELEKLGATVVHKDYLSAATELAQKGRKFDIILLDLGVSSPQLDIPARGFSFRHEGPLDMRMDIKQNLKASDLVNTLAVEDLANLIYEFGEERYSRRIAKAIAAHRPINTTRELASIIEDVVPRHGKTKVHPATRTFQALRVAVNDELNQLQKVLPLVVQLLSNTGRFGVISFHSLEDRIVKQFIKEESESGYESRLVNLLKKPISGLHKDEKNPRARSAKLRAAAKIKTKTERSEHAN